VFETGDKVSKKHCYQSILVILWVLRLSSTTTAQEGLPHEFVLLVHNEAGDSQVILSDTEKHQSQVLWELPKFTQLTVGETISENEVTLMRRAYDEDVVSKKLTEPFQQKITTVHYLDSSHILLEIEYSTCVFVDDPICFGFFEYGNINPSTSDYETWIKIDFHGEGHQASICILRELLQSEVGYIDYENQKIAIQIIPSTKCLNLADIYTLRIDYGDSTNIHLEKINQTVGYSMNGNNAIGYSLADCENETCQVSLQLGTIDKVNEPIELQNRPFSLKLALGFDTAWDNKDILYAWQSNRGLELFDFYHYPLDTQTSQVIASSDYVLWENLHLLGETMAGTKYGTLYLSPPYETISGGYKLESFGDAIVFNTFITCMTDLTLLNSDTTQIPLPLDPIDGCIDDWSLVK
jgi:hypothetical protein